jgi:hypothetical protein
VTDKHKAALAAGREASRAVKRYLEAWEAHKPKRGRKVTTESLQARLDTVEAAIADATDPLSRVTLIQERLDLQERLAALENVIDLTDLEAGFVEHAKTYSTNKGISYAAWRELGVAPDLLKRAGITRS